MCREGRPQVRRMVKPRTLTFEGDGSILNSHLPVLVYDDIAEAHDAGTCERATGTSVTTGGCSSLAPTPTA